MNELKDPNLSFYFLLNLLSKLFIYMSLNIIFGQDLKKDNLLEVQFEELTKEYLSINPEATGVMAAVYYPNRAKWSYSIGNIGRDTSQKIKGDELFVAASITKMFVSTCVLQLQEEGKLSLDDLVTKYVDEAIIKRLTKYRGKSTENKLTLTHLLRHQSGIFDYLNEGQVHLKAYQENPSKNYSLEERLNFALNLGEATNRLGKYSYSNTNYILLGMILEKIENMDISDVLEKRIIRPLKLQNTTLQPSSKLVGKMLKGYYTDWDLTSFTLEFNKNNPAGGILTTREDLMSFGKGLFSGRLFKSKKTLETMLAFENGYGMGMRLFDKSRKTGKIMGHEGFDPGYTCYLIYLEKLDAVIVTVINQSELRVVKPAFLIARIVGAIKDDN